MSSICYYNCDMCDTVFDIDKDEFHEYDVEGYKKQMVCSKCNPIMTRKLIPNTPNFECFLEHRKSLERHHFHNLQYLADFLSGKVESEYRYGVYNSIDSWDYRMLQSFLNNPNCGLEDREVINLGDELLDKYSMKSCYIPLVVGWKGVGKHKVCFVEHNGLFTVDGKQLLEQIQEHINQKGLGGIPFGISAASEYYHKNLLRKFELDIFCDPAKDKNIRWFHCNSLEKFKKLYHSKWDRSKFLKEITWNPTKEYVDVKTTHVRRKIEELENELETLEDLECAKRKPSFRYFSSSSEESSSESSDSSSDSSDQSSSNDLFIYFPF